MAQAAAPLTRFFDTPTKLLLSIVFGLLVIALLVIYALRRQPESFVNPAVRRTPSTISSSKITAAVNASQG